MGFRVSTLFGGTTTGFYEVGFVCSLADFNVHVFFIFFLQ